MADLRRSDFAIALALLLGCALLYGATQQDRLYGDGPALLRMLAHTPDGGPNWIHALHVPTGRLLLALSGSDSPWRTMLWLSSGPGAVMVGATYLLARRIGAHTLEALLCCLLLAVTPAVWFFSTTIELHALHGAVVALAALVAAALPWRRPRIDAWIAGAATLLVFASHQSGALLQPAFAMTAYAAWRGVGTGAPGRVRILAELALPFVVCLGLAIAIGRSWGADMSTVHSGGLADFLLDSQHTPALATVFGMWVPTLALLWVVMLATAFERTTRERFGLAALAAFAPLFAFFTYQGIPERGAYAFGLLPFVTATGACAVTRLHVARRWRLASLTLAIVAQGLLARSSIREFDDGSWGARLAARGAHVRSLGAGEILLLSFDHRMQIVETTNPEIREVDFLRPLVAALESSATPESLALRLEETVAPLLPIPGLTIVVDRGYALELESAPELAPTFAFLEERLRQIADIESRPDGEHDYWVLRPRSND